MAPVIDLVCLGVWMASVRWETRAFLHIYAVFYMFLCCRAAQTCVSSLSLLEGPWKGEMGGISCLSVCTCTLLAAVAD